MIEVAYDISCDNHYLERLAFNDTGLPVRRCVPDSVHFGTDRSPYIQVGFCKRRQNLGRTQIMADQILAKDAAMPWTDERVELLRKLWLDGLSASRIASDLGGGVTRNAVIGKVHRLGLSGRVKAQASSSNSRMRTSRPSNGTQSPAGSRPPMMTRGNVALALRPNAAPAPQVHRDASDVVVPMTANVTIMELRESMCRWPVGDPASSDFRYCGGKAPIGEGPYCAFHSRMAYQPSQDRRHRKSA